MSIINMFNAWLSGLIEGDGTIIVYDNLRTPSGKLLHPYIRIAFHKKDYQLALKISQILGYGSLFISKGNTHTVLLTFDSRIELIDLALRLNGNMRTPKIHKLHQLIDYLGSDFPNKKKDLDTSPLHTNSWFAGMSDADSNFHINLTNIKNNNFRVQRQWRLEFSQKTYHGYDQLHWGLSVSAFLETKLYVRSRYVQETNKIYSSFIAVAFHPHSLNILENYFLDFPLLSSKYLDYLDWKKSGEYMLDLKNNKTDLIFKIKLLKSNMNNKRTQFHWDHLSQNKYFY